jgi:phosphoglycolate phosphatase
MPLTTYLFDLDGTLIDSVADIAAALNDLRGELHLPPLDLPTVRGYVGDGSRLLVTRALPEFREEYLQRFLQLYGANLLGQTATYPGIREFLDLHRHDRLAVVTNKPLQPTLDLLAGLGLADYFPVVIGGESAPALKPDPAPVLLALERLGSSPAEAILIGDHHTDLKAGRAAGVKTCFCAWGIGEAQDIPYDFHAETAYDLLRLFPVEER